MARKNNMKSDNAASIHFDTRTKAVMAEVNTEDKVNIKEKVAAVREVVVGKSTNEIVLVLQYYDYVVESAIQAYLEDGAKEALTEWHFTKGKPSNKKKKNKKSKATNSQGVPDPSLSSTDKKTVPNHTKEPLTNGDLHEEEELLEARARLLDGDLKPTPSAGASASSPELLSAAAASVPSPSSTPEPVVPKSPVTSERSEAKMPSHKPHHRHTSDKHSGAHHHAMQHLQQRQRTSSERSTSSIGSQGVKKPFAGLEKSTKDLQRQTVSLERLRLGLDSEIEKAYKRVKAVFEDACDSLNEREVQLIREMDALKIQGNNVLKMRQEKAAELKVRVERAESLSPADLSELRADIKLFVSDRKIDEDLAKTTRFTYDSDHFLEEVKKFGTVVPVKCSYSTRRPSVSSVASSGVGQEEPLSPVSQHSSQPMHTDQDSASNATDNNMSAAEMAQLQQRLKDSLQLQGLSVKSPPARNQRPAQKVDGDSTDEVRRNRPGRRRREPRDDDSAARTNNNAPSSNSQPAQPHPSNEANSENRGGQNQGNRSPRRSDSARYQSSPRRYGSGGRGRGYRGRGEGYRGDGGYRREEGYRGRGGGRGSGSRGRGGSNSYHSAQSSHSPNIGSPVPVVNGPTVVTSSN